MSATETKSEIQRRLSLLRDAPLASAAAGLLNTLGYRSDKTLRLEPNTAETFIETFVGDRTFNREKGRTDEWRSVDLLFQLTDDEIREIAGGQSGFVFDSTATYNGARVESYLFFAIELSGAGYTRTALADAPNPGPVRKEIHELV